MNCNHDEAIRAMELAKAKFMDKNYNLAKKLALKAQAMSPEIEGVSNFLSVVDVLISSEVKVGDLMDWYRILGVSLTCDAEIIKRRYKAMALALHPDKNKSVGSSDAFKLMAEAFHVLSDPKKRSEYDAKRSLSENPEAEKNYKDRSSEDSSSCNPEKSTARDHNPDSDRVRETQPTTARFTALGSTSGRPRPYPAVIAHMTGLFWTMCTTCSLYHQYGDMFLGQRLVCTSCLSLFIAVEVPSPEANSSQHDRSSFSNPNFRFEAPNHIRTTGFFYRSEWAAPFRSTQGNFYHHQGHENRSIFDSNALIYSTPSYGQGFTWRTPTPGSSWSAQANFHHQSGSSSSNIKPNVADPHRPAWFFPGDAPSSSSTSARPTYSNISYGLGANSLQQMMNMGSSSTDSGFNWYGSNWNSRPNVDLNLGSNRHARARTEQAGHSQVNENMKRPFNMAEQEGGGNDNKKRNTGAEGCKIFGKSFPNFDNNNNDPGSGSSCNNIEQQNG